MSTVDQAVRRLVGQQPCDDHGRCGERRSHGPERDDKRKRGPADRHREISARLGSNLGGVGWIGMVSGVVPRHSQASRATGEREVPTKMVGNLVMEALKRLDKVAYIRFASVYRSFEDIREFGEEIARLQD